MGRESLLAAVLVLAAVSTQSLVAPAVAPSDSRWTGIVRRNTADTNVSLAVIEQHRRGALLARNLFTPEEHLPFQLRPLYLSLGILGRIVRPLSNVALQELGRIATSACFLAIVLVFCRRSFPVATSRAAAILVISMGGGLRWIGPRFPGLGVPSPEGSTFLALLAPPHFALSLALILAIVLCLEAGWRKGSTNGSAVWAVAAGLGGLWLGLEHPFDLPCLGAGVAVALARRGWVRRRPPWPELRAALPLLAGAGGAAALHAGLVASVPVYAAWNRQHIVPSAALLSLLVDWGFLLPLALYGAPAFWRRRPDAAAAAAGFFLASLVGSRLPIPWQGRLLGGHVLMLSLFAGHGLARLLERARSPGGRASLAMIAAGLLTASSWTTLAGDMKTLGAGEFPQYVPARLVEAMVLAGGVVEVAQPILSSPATGNFLPAYAGRPVYVGHRVQTVDFERRALTVARLAGLRADDPAARALAASTGCPWLFWGILEDATLPGSFDPEDASWLRPAFREGRNGLYRILPRAGSQPAPEAEAQGETVH